MISEDLVKQIIYYYDTKVLEVCLGDSVNKIIDYIHNKLLLPQVIVDKFIVNLDKMEINLNNQT